MSETMRRVNALADLLARSCPLRELLSAIRETEGDRTGKEEMAIRRAAQRPGEQGE